MNLKRFRVTNFRSVDDSGWIEADNVTALIGTNESGKTNLLLPLWKLSPAKDGKISETADFPRKHYTNYRSLKDKPTFITAVFELEDSLAEKIAALTGTPIGNVRLASVARDFAGRYFVDFPDGEPARTIAGPDAQQLLSMAYAEIKDLQPLKSEIDAKGKMEAAIESVTALAKPALLDLSILTDIAKTLGGVRTDDAPKTSTLVPRFTRLTEEINGFVVAVSQEHPNENKEARQLVVNHLPKFVYYSNYGNLDSEIYLPHVIENMSRQGLGSKEEAKARTLKVLFEFVGLEPREILELGRDFVPNPPRKLTDAEIQTVAEQKKQRSILLQSAGTKLTQEFRRWWRQGTYRFRFEADGDHFRIWVSDDQRPEEVELEGRSTGLQWFLSFYLVFLVESKDSHEGALLLLDEPGLSLHPMAQRDLSAFFDGLSDTNQLLYTTHSPFLIDANRLDRVRRVYVDDNGTSKATPDLHSSSENKTQRAAGYTVFASLGLTVADSLLLGCEAIIVEGPSDQHYLSAIKTRLVSEGRLRPGRELVFPPAGGTKGVKAVASILTGRDGRLPIALFDADAAGIQTAKQLAETLYAGFPERILNVGQFVSTPNAEIEDILPPSLIAQAVNSVFKLADNPFGENLVVAVPIVPQIESWANKNNVKLELGWKVEVAVRAKQRILSGLKITQDFEDIWIKLFDALTALAA